MHVYIFTYLCVIVVCVCVSVRAHVEIRELACVLLNGSRDSNLGGQAWWQVSLPAEGSLWNCLVIV